MSEQPKWKFLSNLGDATPLDYGGYFVYQDETGVYGAEAELLLPPGEHGGPRRKYEVRRALLERCTFVNGVLSDNRHHPEYPAWFADDIESVANSCGTLLDELRRELCSEDALDRARAYRDIADHFGWDNLDSYPIYLTRAEAEARYKDIPGV